MILASEDGNTHNCRFEAEPDATQHQRHLTCGHPVHQLTSSVALMLLLQLSSTPCPNCPSNRQ